MEETKINQAFQLNFNNRLPLIIVIFVLFYACSMGPGIELLAGLIISVISIYRCIRIRKGFKTLNLLHAKVAYLILQILLSFVYLCFLLFFVGSFVLGTSPERYAVFLMVVILVNVGILILFELAVIVARTIIRKQTNISSLNSKVL